MHLIGCVLSVAGFFWLVRRASWHFGCHGGPWRHGRWHHFRRARWWEGGDDFAGRGYPGAGPGAGLGGVLEHLEATPAQERVVRSSLDELWATASALRAEAATTRLDVAQAFRKPSFDAEAMGELFARHDTVLESLRRTFVGAAAKVHDALDEKQRARLADLIASGPRGFRGHGGWRDRRASGSGYDSQAW